MSKKRQSNIFFRSLALPPSSADSDGEGDKDSKKKPDYCPHFLPALQLIAHTLIPVRKALVHFYVSYRNKDVKKLEWLTLLGFGRLFRDLITASNSSGNSVLSAGSSANTGSMAEDAAANLKPVSSDRFFPGLYTALLKHDLERWPKDVTEAIHVLLDCLTMCARTIPVTNHLWSALLDKACTGLIVSQSLVGRRKKEKEDDKEVPQRSHKEQVILWCPHVFPIGDISRIPPPSPPKKGTDDDDDENIPTLQQLIEADFRKRPLSTTSRSYYDFDKKSYDFEVQIPTKFLDEKDDDKNGESKPWKTTRSLQFASLTGYLFLGIDRMKGDEKSSNGKIDRSEVAIPATLDLTKLCSKKKGSKTTLPKEAIYELVGGALYDDGEYVAVLKDYTAAALAEEKKANNGGDDSDDEEETWKLMESEETIPMSESDVLEFLKGEEADEDDDSDDEEDGAPCGTLAVYKLRLPSTTKAATTIFGEMDTLLSDIVISQISGSLNSKTDFYIEEEIIEEEIIED